MEFKRKRVKGSQKTHKLWVSDCGDYRVSWTDEYGFPHYYAAVRTERFDGKVWWNFVGRRGTYKTRKKAFEECERNKKLWEAFIKLSHSDGRRDTRLTTLKDRAPNVFTSLPVWVRPLAEPKLIEILFPCLLIQDQDEDTTASSTSDSESLAGDREPSSSLPRTKKSTPASIAAETVLSMTAVPADLTTGPTESPAQPAEEVAAAKRKSSKQPTRKQFATGAKSSKPGRSAKRSAKAASKSSPRKKGKR
jgi:hypothetical protein